MSSDVLLVDGYGSHLSYPIIIYGPQSNLLRLDPTPLHPAIFMISVTHPCFYDAFFSTS